VRVIPAQILMAWYDTRALTGCWCVFTRVIIRCLSSVAVDRHSWSVGSGSTYLRRSSSFVVVLRRSSSPFVVLRRSSSSFAVARHPSSPFVVLRCRSLSFAVARCHRRRLLLLSSTLFLPLMSTLAVFVVVVQCCLWWSAFLSKLTATSRPCYNRQTVVASLCEMRH